MSNREIKIKNIESALNRIGMKLSLQKKHGLDTIVIVKKA